MASSIIPKSLQNALTPSFTSAGSGSEIKAERIGNVVCVSGILVPIEGTTVYTMSGLPTRVTPLTNGFGIIMRNQQTGALLQAWSSGSNAIIVSGTAGQPHGFSYSYICQ